MNVSEDTEDAKFVLRARSWGYVAGEGSRACDPLLGKHWVKLARQQIGQAGNPVVEHLPPRQMVTHYLPANREHALRTRQAL